MLYDKSNSMFKRMSPFLPLFLLLILATAVRLPLLGGSFWLDEAAQALESARPFNQQLNILNDFQPPLMHYIVHFALFASSEEWWLRTIGALLPALGTIAATYLLAKKFFSTQTAILATLLLATSSFHIFYSQELRPYSLPALWAVLSWYCVLTLLTTRKSGFLLTITFIATSLLGLYSSYLYIFLNLSQILFLFIFKSNDWKKWLAASCGIGLGFLPWLPTFLQQLQVGQSWRTQLPGWEQVVSFGQLKSVLLTIGKFIFGVMNLEVTVFFVVSTLIFISSILYLILSNHNQVFHLKSYFSNSKKPFISHSVLAVLCWMIVPFLLGWIVSFWVPVIQPKRVLYLLPAAYILIAHVLVSAKQTKLAVATFLFVLALNILGLQRYYSQPNLQRENWRELHTQLQKKYPASESVVLFSFTGPFAPWHWYAGLEYPVLSTESLFIDSSTQIPKKFETITQYSYVIVVDYLADLSDPSRETQAYVERLGFTKIETLQYPGIGSVFIYALPPITLSLEKKFSTTLPVYESRY